MPYLIEARQAQIAAEIEAILAQGTFFSDPDKGTQEKLGAAKKYWKALAGTGFAIQAEAASPAAKNDVLVLDQLVSKGTLSGAEARAYLASKYPDQKWSGGEWGDKTTETANAKAVEEAAKPDADPSKLGPLEQALAVQQATGVSPNFGVDGTGGSFALDELPEEYDQEQAQAVVESFADRVAGRVEAVRHGDVTFPAHSIQGAVIAPGSLSLAALNPYELREFTSTLPGPDLAINLGRQHDPAMDRHVDGGPGRVWRVTAAHPPAGWSPKPGPIRYRILIPGMVFGVSSVELASSDPTSTVEMAARYGIVLAGIPSFGRRVERILAVEGVGDHPLAYAVDEVSTGGVPDGPFRLYHDRARAQYETADYTTTGRVGSNANLSPTQASRDTLAGFAFGLLTGRTSEEVYQELSTRRTTWGARWASPGGVRGLSFPGHLAVEPLAPGQAIQWDGQVGGSAGYVGLDEGDDLTSEGRLIEGLPFEYSDCERLRASDTRFALVIQPVLAHTTTLGGSETWPSPSGWYSQGLELEKDSQREWAVDLIVQ